MPAIAVGDGRRVVGRARSWRRSIVRNGATVTMSPFRSCDVSRRAVARTRSIRRDMLWLPSTSSVNCVGTLCSCTRSSACLTVVFEQREVAVLERRNRTGRPGPAPCASTSTDDDLRLFDDLERLRASRDR